MNSERVAIFGLSIGLSIVLAGFFFHELDRRKAAETEAARYHAAWREVASQRADTLSALEVAVGLSSQPGQMFHLIAFKGGSPEVQWTPGEAKDGEPCLPPRLDEWFRYREPHDDPGQWTSRWVPGGWVHEQTSLTGGPKQIQFTKPLGSK